MEFEPIVFSIEERTYPTFKESAIGKALREITPDDLEYSQKFGKDYGGEIILKFPNLGDRAKINAIVQRKLIEAGFPTPAEAPMRIWDQEYGFAVIQVLATKKPEWLAPESLYSDLDQLAVAEIGRSFNEALDQKKRPSMNGSRAPS